VGEFIEGNVTKLVPFGAFVKVEDGIEGLIHISELAEAHVEVPEQVVKVNDPITVKIIDIDDARRRISLSLKQAVKAGYGEEPEIAEEPSFSAGGDDDADTGGGSSAMGAALAEALQRSAGSRRPRPRRYRGHRGRQRRRRRRRPAGAGSRWREEPTPAGDVATDEGRPTRRPGRAADAPAADVPGGPTTDDTPAGRRGATEEALRLPPRSPEEAPVLTSAEA
jgi:small subunit ribosomal protein S1